jgi:hypothetical protein
MNDEEIGRRVARQLEASLDRIEPAITRQLAAARAAAMDLARDTSLAYGAASWSAGGARLGGMPRGHGLRRYWLPAAVLAAGLAAIISWNTITVPQDDETELLADELPLNAFLDKGFDEWLASSGH